MNYLQLWSSSLIWAEDQWGMFREACFITEFVRRSCAAGLWFIFITRLAVWCNPVLHLWAAQNRRKESCKYILGTGLARNVIYIFSLYHYYSALVHHVVSNQFRTNDVLWQFSGFFEGLVDWLWWWFHFEGYSSCMACAFKGQERSSRCGDCTYWSNIWCVHKWSPCSD